MAREMNLNFVDKVMCSDVCPCGNEYKGLWFKTYDEAKISKVYHRTWAAKDFDGLVHMNFGKDEEPAPAPVATKNGTAGKGNKGPPVAMTAPAPKDDTKTYATFEECYMAKIHGQPPISRDEKYKEAEKEYAGKDTIDTLRHYEKEFDCSGICDVPLFYLSRDLSDGPPPEDCVDAILKSFTDSYAIACISFALFLIFFFGALATVPNCCGMNSENKKGKHHALAEDPNATQNTAR